MRSAKTLLIVLAFVGIFFSSNAQNASDSKEKAAVQNDVTVYYFHLERRCVTCKTVEVVSKKAVAELYEGAVKYKVFNLEGERGKSMAKKLRVAAQALVIVKGDKKIDITSESFRYAKNNPEKVKALIKEKTDPLLKKV